MRCHKNVEKEPPVCAWVNLGGLQGLGEPVLHLGAPSALLTDEAQSWKKPKEGGRT